MNYKKPFTHSQNTKVAFTLIELLVVIAIIAMLSAILFPAFSRAREAARKAACMSNLKQIGLGILQYTQDYDQAFPLIDGNGLPTILSVINPYIKSSQLWVCPSQPQTSPTTVYPTYGVNIYGINGGNNLRWGTPFNRLNFSTVNPFKTDAMMGMDTIALFCSNRSNNYYCNNTPGCATGTATSGQNWDATTGWMQSALFLQQDPDTTGVWRHNGTTNLLFTDGHVKAMPPTMVKVGMWTAQPGD